MEVKCEKGSIVIITGSLGIGKITVSFIIVKESNIEKSIHMHTDDFYHCLSKGAIPSHKQNSVVIEAFLEAVKRFVEDMVSL